MVDIVTALVGGFLLSVVVFAVGTVWVSIGKDAHTPEGLQSDGSGGDERE